MATLTIKSGGTEERVPVQAPKTVVGRGVESDVKLKDIKVSKQHFAIVRTPTGYSIQDLSSGTGTLVNGQPVQNAHPLKAGDVIKVGDTQIVFASDGQSSKTGAMPAKPPTQRVASASSVKPSRPAPPPTGVQTRPTTRAMAPVAKAGSGSTQKGTARMAPTKPPTVRAGVARPPTSRLKPPTSRRDPKEARRAKKLGFVHRELRGGKKSKVPLFIGLGVLLVAAIAAFAFMGGGDGGSKRGIKDAEQMINEGYALLDENKYDEAKDKFQRAMDLALAAGKAGETLVARAKAGLSDVQRNADQLKALRDKWIAIKAEYEKGGYDIEDIVAKVIAYQELIKDLKVDFKDDVQITREKVEREYETKKAEKGRVKWVDYYRQYVKPLEDKSQWAQAIAMCAAFPGADKTEANRKAEQIDIAANTEWTDTLKRSVGKLIRDGKTADAIKLLEGRLPDFEGTIPYKGEKGMKALLDWLKDGKEPGDFFK